MGQYDHIELTPEEEKAVTDAAIYNAKKMKAARLHEQAYANRIKSAKKFLTMDYEALSAFVKSKHPDFVIDNNNKEIFEMLCLYFSGDAAFDLQGDGFSLKKGIMLYGPVGCGKTSLMKMFAINSFRPFSVIACRSVADAYQQEGAGALTKYADLHPVFPDLNFGIAEIGRCFDDLGTEENKKNFGNQVNVMQDVFYKIYDAGLIGQFHLTTNLTANEIEESYGNRIRSRMREMFNVITFSNESPDRRK